MKRHATTPTRGGRRTTYCVFLSCHLSVTAAVLCWREQKRLTSLDWMQKGMGRSVSALELSCVGVDTLDVLSITTAAIADRQGSRSVVWDASGGAEGPLDSPDQT